MTDYQMPALTEQEREELQNYLTDCVEHRAMVMSIQDSLRLNTLRDKIALAALTAEPVYQIMIYGEWVDTDEGEYGGANSAERRVLYHYVPPVTIVPDKMAAVVACEHEYVEGWNDCRAAMLRFK